MSGLDLVPDPALSGHRRRRAWLLAACAALAAATYLTIWFGYATSGLVSSARLEPVPAGATVASLDADFRLLSLRRSRELTSTSSSGNAYAVAGAVFVVAELEVTPRRLEESLLCSAELVGPEGRRWEPGAGGFVLRVLPGYCDTAEMQVGRPYRMEQIYQVPSAMADQLAGVLLLADRERTPRLLRPPR